MCMILIQIVDNFLAQFTLKSLFEVEKVSHNCKGSQHVALGVTVQDNHT